MPPQMPLATDPIGMLLDTAFPALAGLQLDLITLCVCLVMLGIIGVGIEYLFHPLESFEGWKNNQAKKDRWEQYRDGKDEEIEFKAAYKKHFNEKWKDSKLS